MRFVLIVSIFCIGPLLLMAQQREDIFDGYIITLQGEVIRGSIREKSTIANSNSCDFKKHAESLFSAYRPDQISGYGYGKYIYHSVAIRDVIADKASDDQAFLQVLSRGTLELYMYTDRRGKEHFIFKNDSGDLYLLETRIMQQAGRSFQFDAYKGLLKINMNCGDIHALIEKTNLTEKSVVQLFNRYNACIDSGFEPFSKEKRAFLIRIGVSASMENYGLSFSHRGEQYDTKDIMAKRFSQVDLNNSRVFGYGVFADFGSSKSRRFFARVGYELPRVVEWTSTDTSKSTVNGKISSVPITLFYNLGMRRIRVQPFFGIAVVFIANDDEVPIVYRFPGRTFFFDENGNYIYGPATLSYNVLRENDIKDTTFSGSIGLKLSTEPISKLGIDLSVSYFKFLGNFIGEKGLSSSFGMLSTSVSLTYKLK